MSEPLPTTDTIDIEAVVAAIRASPQLLTRPAPHREQAAEIDGALVVALKRIVCNIEQSVEYALRQEKVGVFTGTGFVVYLSKSIALVATNEHLSGISPQQVKLTFENGATCEAQGPVWVDPWHDLSFYKFNPAELEYEELACAEIGSSLTLQEQTPVLLIGNNDQEEYSVKFGRVTNLQLGSGDRHSASFQSSFDRTKGSSGSPVFDQRGKVVGIHMRGTHTTSIELRVEYIKKALDQLVKVDPSGEVTITGHVQRGELGLELQLTRASLVKQHFQFPQKLLTELRNSRPKLKQVLLVYKVVPITSPAFKAGIQAGDVIWSVNGTVVGDDLFQFDDIIDQSVNKEATIEIYRNGVKKTTVCRVDDANYFNVTKFALINGGVFHDITPSLRLRFEIHTRGVFLSQVSAGSPLQEVGEGSNESVTNYATVVEQINGIPTPNIKALIEVLWKLQQQKQKHIWILSRNYRNIFAGPRAYMVTLEYKFGPLRVFSFDLSTFHWNDVTEVTSAELALAFPDAVSSQAAGSSNSLEESVGNDSDSEETDDGQQDDDEEDDDDEDDV